jgi:hypothetical protein
LALSLVEQQQILSQVLPKSVLIIATASALLSIRVAADLEETIALLKRTIDAHPGINLSIDIALPAILLDTDVNGFEKIVVSYFTVLDLCQF